MSSDFTRRYELGVQRNTQLDLAVNGLVDQRTFADPRRAPTAEQFQATQDRISVLLEQASGREFTDSEQLEWSTAMHTTAAHYAADEQAQAR
jgi:hypothetical protein